MLFIHRLGKNAIHYIRGSAALTDKRIHVKEFCTGPSDADAASRLMPEYETLVHNQLMFEPAALHR